MSDIEKIIKEISKYVKKNSDSQIDSFNLGEKYGIHITPMGYYQPIPDTTSISENTFGKPLHFAGIDLREEEQFHLLEKLSLYVPELELIPNSKTNSNEYYFENPMFGYMDGAMYYSIIREFKPKKIIEVGSGFSTLLASNSASKNENTSIISIDLYPPPYLKKSIPNLLDLIKKPVQEVPIDKFKELEENDILFIDSSHVSKINSDVNYLFLHVLPELNDGVIVHVHDFFFPFEYPKVWVMEEKRFWNELYLVWAFLIGNSNFEILLTNHYLKRVHAEKVDFLFPFLIGKMGAGSLWIRKKNNST